MLTTRLNDKILSGELKKGCIVELSEYVCNEVQDRNIIIVMNAAIKHDSVPCGQSNQCREEKQICTCTTADETDVSTTETGAESSASQQQLPTTTKHVRIFQDIDDE